MTDRTPPIPSPCVKVCAIDPDDRVCMGCYRSLEEIAAWPRLSELEKVALNATLEERRAKLGPYLYNASNRRR